MKNSEIDKLLKLQEVQQILVLDQDTDIAYCTKSGYLELFIRERDGQIAGEIRRKLNDKDGLITVLENIWFWSYYYQNKLNDLYPNIENPDNLRTELKENLPKAIWEDVEAKWQKELGDILNKRQESE